MNQSSINRQNIDIPQNWVLPLAITIFLIPLILIEYSVLNYTGGVWAYPLDDAFIHMGIAKNISLYGIWGISKGTFVSASSSILYPLVLAGIFLLTGPNILVPLVLNTASAIVALVVSTVWLKKQGLSAIQQLISLTILTILIPLPVIASIGMEHTLQILFSTIFIFKFSAWLEAQADSGKKTRIHTWELCVYATLNTAIRYEGLFLIFTACLLLLYKKQVKSAFAIGTSALMPVVIFGLISLYNNNYFIPNSVLLKSNELPNDIKGLFQFISDGVFKKIYYTFPTVSSVASEKLLVILPVAYLIFSSFFKSRSIYKYALLLSIGTTFLHLVLSTTGWFFRYEAYLIATPVLVIAVLTIKYWKKLFLSLTKVSKLALLLIFALLIYPFIQRSLDAFENTKGACQNIYDQNYNMAAFSHKYYDTTTIAVNDLGCPSYLTSGKIIDLWGLGNMNVARSKRNGYYTSTFLDSLTQKESAKIAIIFERLYNSELLHKWHKIAVWHIDDIIVSGDPNLCFYTIDTTYDQRLKENLTKYQSQLPIDVTVKYFR